MTDLAVAQWDQLPELNWSDKVAYLAYQFLKLPQIECPVEHEVGNGMYLRKMRIPAGTLFLGRAHRYGHECHLVEGSVIYITPHGKKEVHAPFIVHTTPGTHMVLFTMTDIIGLTAHPNRDNSLDFDAMEADIFESVESTTQRGRIIDERLRYQAMLAEYGVDESKWKALIESEADQIPFPHPVKVHVGASPVHGKGLVASADIGAQELIGPAKISEKRTPAGRYTNHAFEPNAEFIAIAGDIALIARQPIREGDEVTVDYRQAILTTVEAACQAPSPLSV